MVCELMAALIKHSCVPIEELYHQRFTVGNRHFLLFTYSLYGFCWLWHLLGIFPESFSSQKQNLSQNKALGEAWLFQGACQKSIIFEILLRLLCAHLKQLFVIPLIPLTSLLYIFQSVKIAYSFIFLLYVLVHY